MNDDGMGTPAPLTHQSRAGLEHRNGIAERTALPKISDQGLHPALQPPAHRAVGTLLQLIGEASDQQIATEPPRRFCAMHISPGKPQLVRRALHQLGDLQVDIGYE
jgi:hypothetical protein